MMRPHWCADWVERINLRAVLMDRARGRGSDDEERDGGKRLVGRIDRDAYAALVYQPRHLGNKCCCLFWSFMVAMPNDLDVDMFCNAFLSLISNQRDPLSQLFARFPSPSNI
ncbi:hypothetical protein VNO77_35263 [Canavalia gladiata]|uniref:Uncharacterized protein n=1 Tax=Canavalia gladiata TaxID=3824 RepID=A0AAN9KIE2_CANGL